MFLVNKQRTEIDSIVYQEEGFVELLERAICDPILCQLVALFPTSGIFGYRHMLIRQQMLQTECLVVLFFSLKSKLCLIKKQQLRINILPMLAK